MGRSKVSITVRGEVFKIEFVSNWATVEYYKMNKLITNVTNKSDELSSLMKNVNNGTVDKDRGLAKIKIISREIEAIGTEDFFEKRYEIIQEILEGNNYKFDKRFWERKCDPNDLNSFLNQCYLKDIDTGSKKKVEAEI